MEGWCGQAAAVPGVTASDRSETSARTAGVTSSRRWWRWFVPIVAVGISALAAEGTLRFAGVRSNAHFYQPDAELGWRLKPGYSGWAVEEARVWVDINADGQRGADRPRQKPANVIRVALLGDSFMEGFSVPLEQSFAVRLQDGLTECVRPFGRSVEVINFGTSGYNLAQSLLTYRQHAASYAPDLVLLAIYTDNDIHGNHPELNPLPDPSLSPYLLPAAEGLRLVPPRRDRLADAFAKNFYLDEPIGVAAPWHQPIRIALTNRSLLLRHIYRAYAEWSAAAPEVHADAGSADPEDAGVYREPDSDELRQAWTISEALLDHFAREVAAHERELWIMTLANEAQVDPDVSSRAARARRLSVADLLYPDRRFAAVASRLGIGHIGLAEPMSAHAASQHAYLNGGGLEPLGSGHWNALGNDLAAGLAVQRLCKESAAIAAARGRH